MSDEKNEKKEKSETNCRHRLSGADCPFLYRPDRRIALRLFEVRRIVSGLSDCHRVSPDPMLDLYLALWPDKTKTYDRRP